MVKLLLGLDAAPSPHDAADAVAVAICHIHSATGAIADAAGPQPRAPGRRSARGPGRRSLGQGGPMLTSWRDYRP